MGSDSTAVNNAVSVGSATERRRIANVADGTQDTDAATVGQVKHLISQNSGTVLNPENPPESPSPVLGPNSSDVVFQAGTGDSSVIAGINNKATGWQSLAFGHDNEATDSNSSAFGFKNIAKGDYSSTFGNANTATKHASSAFGYGNKAEGDNSSAFGFENTASGTNSSAFGYQNTASGKRSAAFGLSNKAEGNDSFAFGRGNRAIGTESLAFGDTNKVNKSHSSAFGISNTVDGDFASAFGYKNSASGNSTSAFGYEVSVSGEGSGAFGRGSYNFSQGHKYKIEGNNSWAIGSYNKIATGSDNNHILGNNIAIGTGINNSIVLGNKSTVEESDTLSIGSATNKRRIVHVAEGTADTDAATVGQVKNLLASSSGSGGTVDAYTKAETDSKFATKTDMENIKTNKVDKDASNLSESDVNAWKAKLGVGTGSGTPIDAYTKAESDNKFATVDSLNNKLDKEVYNKEKANFATKTELDSKVNKDGSNLSENDITIWKEKLAVATVNGIANTATGNQSTGLGHGNVISGNYSTAVGYKNKVSGNNSGAFGDPNIVTGNRSYAFGNDNTIAGDDNFVLGSNVKIGEGITNSVALGNNSTVSGSNEVSVGSSANKRKITNVADGEVSETSSDAVTGKQLYNAMKNTSGVENLRNEVNEKFADVKSKINHVGSLSAALSALHPMQYDPKAPNQIMAAVGHYKDKQAVAVGLNHYFSPNFMVNAGVALGNESKVNTMANLGFTWKIGKGSEEMPQENFSTELQRLTAENRELNERIRRLEEAIKKGSLSNRVDEE